MTFKSLKETIIQIETKKISIRELNEVFIKKIKENTKLNIFIHFDEQKIISQIDKFSLKI